jgi:c-di-GMP-binding flagellar brake protein YcgR
MNHNPTKGIFAVERRKHPRVSVELPLNYSLGDTKENGGITANVSEGGLLVYLSEKIDIGSRLKIEILFIEGMELNTIKGTVKGIWSESAAKGSWGKYRYGLQFESFHEGDLDKLKMLLKEAGQMMSNELNPDPAASSARI